MATKTNPTTVTTTIGGGTLTVTPKTQPYNEVQNSSAFAVIKADGSVVTWGTAGYGGDSSAVAKQLDGTIDVTQIFSTASAFAALRADGSVVTWGYGYDGDSSAVAKQLDGTIDVTQIFSNSNYNGSAFAALRADGSVVTWGSAKYGGDSSVYHFDFSSTQYVKDYSVAKQLDGTIDVTQIFSTGGAFAALRADGSVVTWGNAIDGGDSFVYRLDDYSSLQLVKDYSVAKQLDGTIDVTQIFSTASAFAALRADGSVVTWGDVYGGGNSSAVAKQLDGTIDVTQIFSNGGAFAALRTDGSVVTWGDADFGGNSSAVAKQLDGTIDVTQIFSNGGVDFVDGAAFAALRTDGSVVTWGRDMVGGDSSVYHWVSSSKQYAKDYAVASQLTSGVVSFANAATQDVYLATSAASGTQAQTPPTGNVTISGTAQPNQILVANNTLADANGINSAITYQWFSNSTAISGANQASYALLANDVGKNISVSASYTDGLGKVESVSSSAVTVGQAQQPPTGNVTISGAAQPNQTLYASDSLADVNGIVGNKSYQWLSNGSVINGATQVSYTLSNIDIGKGISVIASYTDGLGKVESVSSSTVTVGQAQLPPTGNVTISGTAQPNQILVANNTLADANGINSAITYQWLSNGSVINGATQVSYTLLANDAGNNISVKVSYTDGLGKLESVSSNAVTVSQAQLPPTGNVTISGTAKPNQTLTAKNTLADVNGLGTLNYQWMRNGVEIKGENKATYSVSTSDVDKKIAVTISYIDGLGKLESMMSSATTITQTTNAVTITGTPSAGNVLSTSLTAQTIKDTLGVNNVTYQWYNNGTEIEGATQSHYTVEALKGNITLKVSYETNSGKIITLASSPLNVATGVAISGTGDVGEMLTAVPNLIDALGVNALSYQWYANGKKITGAIEETYLVTTEDEGKDITVNVTYYHNNDQRHTDPQTYKSYLPVHIGNNSPSALAHYSLSVSTPSVDEGDTSPVVFTVTVDNAPEQAVTIPFTLKGAATANTDFKGTLTTQKVFTIAAGETEGSLSLTAVLDNKAEKTEQVSVLLGTPSDGGTVDDPEQHVDIYDVYQGKNTADTYVAFMQSKVYGNGGNDKLDGSAGLSTLDGGAGNDTLIAGKGDELTGGEGKDTFVFKKGSSSDNPEEVAHITDLAAGDKIDLSAISKTALNLVKGIADDLDGAGLTLAASKMNVYLAYDSTLGDDNLYLVYETSAKGVHTHEAIELVGLNPDDITLGLKSGVLTVS